jgi:alpha-beta hydrolase superfamily lysophospholipase
MAVRRIVTGSLRRVLFSTLHAAAGATVVLLVGGVLYLDARPDLDVWHTAELDLQFTVDSPIDTFEAYRKNEDRLFLQVQEEVYAKVAPEPRNPINRFQRGSLSDPTSYPQDWNRSFEIAAPEAPAGILLLHGLSDSPYSMRSLALRLRAEGFHVLGLRVPGHGLAPVGLTTTTWQDMAAAVPLAMKHLAARLPGRPLAMVGYSNGGALAVHYSLRALEDYSLPPASRLVLLSPEVGITGLASLAVWQQRLGHLLGLRKLEWNSISLEFDPYKYGSFAINAGKQAYDLTLEIQTLITRFSDSGVMQGFPQTLAFQSVADATVSVPALVTDLFDRLPDNGSELALFDINRSTAIEPLLRQDPIDVLRPLLADRERDFGVTLIRNQSEETAEVEVSTISAGAIEASSTPLGIAWPRELYSLAHVSLPFPPDDPIYGGRADASEGFIQIGGLALRGERGVLRVSSADMLRLRWNPFHDYLADRTVQWIAGGVTAH